MRTYKKCFRHYPFWAYSKLEKWLNKMSLKGWRLVDYGYFTFKFAKAAPKDIHYLAYTVFNRKYCLTYSKMTTMQSYGFFIDSIEKRKSELRKANHKRGFNIIEIDENKIDINTNIGYLEFISERKRLYRNEAIAESILSLIVAAGSVVLYLMNYVGLTYLTVMLLACIMIVFFS